MSDQSFSVQYNTALSDVKGSATMTIALKQVALPGQSNAKEFVLEAKAGGYECIMSVQDIANALMHGTISETRSDFDSGTVASAYTALDAAIDVMVDGDHVPAAGDVLGVADDHDNTNILYAEIASVVATNAPVYAITLENALANAYVIGAPVAFYAGIPPAVGYDRISEGIGTRYAKPAVLSATWATATLTVAAITDKAVLYNGCVAIWVSDTKFTPRNVSRIDGIYPDKIVEGSNFAVEYGITPFTTMNGGAAIGTGPRYFLPLAIPNKTAAQCANTSAGTGMFGAIFGAMPVADISGTVS